MLHRGVPGLSHLARNRNRCHGWIEIGRFYEASVSRDAATAMTLWRYPFAVARSSPCSSLLSLMPHLLVRVLLRLRFPRVFTYRKVLFPCAAVFWKWIWNQPCDSIHRSCKQEFAAVSIKCLEKNSGNICAHEGEESLPGKERRILSETRQRERAVKERERYIYIRLRLREYIRNSWCVASCKMKVSAKERDRFAPPCLREGRANGFSDMKRRRWCNKETRSEANRYQASAVFKRWPEIKCVQLRYRKIKQREHLLDAFDLLLRPAKRHTRHARVRNGEHIHAWRA